MRTSDDGRLQGQACRFDQQLFRLAKHADSVSVLYPELICVERCPPAATTIAVSSSYLTPLWFSRNHTACPTRKRLSLEGAQEMLDTGIIKPSTSSFTSPITIIRKENGTYRLCANYHLVNQQTYLFPFSMPRIDDIINET